MQKNIDRKIALMALALSWGLVGCLPIVIPLPPPSSPVVGADALDAGDVEIMAGVSAAVEASDHPASLNPLGGGLPLGLSVGINDRVQISATYGFEALAPNAGVELAYHVLNRDNFSVSLLGGMAGSYRSDSYTTTEVLTNEDGTPQLDENGDEITEDSSNPYSYLGITPSFGGRVVRQIGNKFYLTGLVRLSSSHTIALDGLEDWDMPKSYYGEGELGLIFEPVSNLQVGVGAMTYLVKNANPDSSTDVYPLIASMSVGYTF